MSKEKKWGLLAWGMLALTIAATLTLGVWGFIICFIATIRIFSRYKSPKQS
jgi:hypothetical protein